MGNGPFLRLQGQKPTAVFKAFKAYIGLGVHFSPKQSRLGFNEGMESRELRKAGGASTTLSVLGWGSLRASVSPSLPATLPRILSRETVTFKVPSVGLLLYSRHYAGCYEHQH